MITLTPAQIADLRELQQFCEELKTELVIIGAIAYQHNFPNEQRLTGDIDTAVALDLDDFGELERRLQGAGWARIPNREHRWRSTQATLIDLVPAGRELRNAKQLTWPDSQFTMSLVGFDHVFSEAQPVEITDRFIIGIIPSPVLMLLKIVAFMDDQNRRAKDLTDIRAMLALYDADSDRVFSEVVLDAALNDISLASAFLLGADLRSFCTLDELVVVQRFLGLIGDEMKPAWPAFVRAAPLYSKQKDEIAQAELAAFAKGLNTGKLRPTTDTTKQRTVPRQASVFERLSALAKEGALVRVNPLIPAPRYDRHDEFKIRGVDPAKDVLITEKLSGEAVYLPFSQIEAVLHSGPGTKDLIRLKGRLQWMTLAKKWEVRPEKPDSEWGIAKRSGDGDPRVAEIQRSMQVKGGRVGWASENTVNTEHGADREIIYDMDGCYLRKRDRPCDQILVRSPGQK